MWVTSLAEVSQEEQTAQERAGELFTVRSVPVLVAVSKVNRDLSVTHGFGRTSATSGTEWSTPFSRKRTSVARAQETCHRQEACGTCDGEARKQPRGGHGYADGRSGHRLPDPLRARPGLVPVYVNHPDAHSDPEGRCC
ncbi:hypothetical protein TREES_T100014624 [Tupaia chinensis]|uniref:Uncharacterized protein n=1 Tax=Tupaia chinensis TaxID=246437 RepID=L9L1Y8_TUPCH|nr:hypothetical protein TREES_T100014624 [Tupaia chinensis]